ncbi:MAG: glycosyltransferase family 4 protein [Pyrinomonadaceae bacterium]
MTTDRPKLKLWHIAETYPPGYGGGATVYMRDVCRYLTERGHTIRVLCTEGSDAEPYTIRTEHDGPIRVDRLNLPYFKRQDPGGWQLSKSEWQAHGKRIAKVADDLMQNWTPDLVQFHTPYPVDEEFLLRIHERGLPLVGMSHCAWTICSRLNLLHSPSGEACSGPSKLKCLSCLYSHYDGSKVKAAAKLPWRMLKLGTYPAFRLGRRDKLRRAIQGQISYSEYMTAAHEGQVGGINRFVPLGIDLSGTPSERLPRKDGPLRFGFMAGFQPHKGIWDLLDTAAALAKKGLAFEVHIWGPHQDENQVVLAERGLSERVFLHGTFSGDEKWAAFAAIDVLVMATTVVEAYGRVVQEAAAMGLPTIAPAVGGIIEQIRDESDGLLYRFRDRAHLEAQMERVIRSPELAGELARNLRPVLETRDAVTSVEQFYYDILNQGGG